MLRTILGTIALTLTYEIELKGNITLEDLKNYPKTKEKLPPEILTKIEEIGDYGELVDEYIEVVEAVDVDKELFS